MRATKPVAHHRRHLHHPAPPSRPRYLPVPMADVVQAQRHQVVLGAHEEAAALLVQQQGLVAARALQLEEAQPVAGPQLCRARTPRSALPAAVPALEGTQGSLAMLPSHPTEDFGVLGDPQLPPLMRLEVVGCPKSPGTPTPILGASKPRAGLRSQPHGVATSPRCPGRGLRPPAAHSHPPDPSHRLSRLHRPRSGPPSISARRAAGRKGLFSAPRS